MILNIKSRRQDYDCYIEKGIIKHIKQLIPTERKILIVTDSNIPESYIDIIKYQIKSPYIYKFEAGEASKNLNTYMEIMHKLIKHHFSRNDAIIALGGGVTGDLAGFAASTFMRGIDFYNIPTSFLSMVDSSVGGKTAIDYENIKNVVGTFYSPNAVFIDTDLLSSLPLRELYNGLAESIKMAMTFDKDLFELIEKTDDLSKDLDEIIYRSLLIKKSVVEADEYETGYRRLLNFGHTIGHALESSMNGELLHGEAISIGMVYMTEGIAKERLINVLKEYNLPTSHELNKDEIMDLIGHDKKRKGAEIDVIKCKRLGTCEIVRMKTEDLREML